MLSDILVRYMIYLHIYLFFPIYKNIIFKGLNTFGRGSRFVQLLRDIVL